MDETRADLLSGRFHEVFRTFDAGPDLFTPDAFFDLNMPVWRFQLTTFMKPNGHVPAATLTVWPIASSAAFSAGVNAPASASTTSGMYWWW